MTGRIHGTITSTRLLADVEPGKYRIWCALHQVVLLLNEFCIADEIVPLSMRSIGRYSEKVYIGDDTSM